MIDFSRNNMFELADRLIGIYKTYDTTKSVTINPKQFSVEATEAGENAAKTEKEKEQDKSASLSRIATGPPLSDATNRLPLSATQL